LINNPEGEVPHSIKHRSVTLQRHSPNPIGPEYFCHALPISTPG